MNTTPLIDYLMDAMFHLLPYMVAFTVLLWTLAIFIRIASSSTREKEDDEMEKLYKENPHLKGK